MKTVKKKEGKIIQAYCLGEDHPELNRLLEAERIKKEDENRWRIFSREVIDGKGELAFSGDYIKLDSAGAPYPNKREYFLKNHRHIEGDNYEQIPQLLNAWSADEEMCPEIQFLIDHKGLVIDGNNQERYFSAPLWGDILSAAKDAIIVFYELKYDSEDLVIDATYNFVAKDEFVKTYDVINETGIVPCPENY